MPHSEKLLQRETLGKNRVFTHERWQVQLENGRTAEREIIRHPGGGRHCGGGCRRPAADGCGSTAAAWGQESLEIPAGKRDPGETPEDCGRRELEEECGFIAGRLEPLAALYPTPAYCDEKIWIFTAGALTAGHTHPDETIHHGGMGTACRSRANGAGRENRGCENADRNTEIHGAAPERRSP